MLIAAKGFIWIKERPQSNFTTFGHSLVHFAPNNNYFVQLDSVQAFGLHGLLVVSAALLINFLVTWHSRSPIMESDISISYSTPRRYVADLRGEGL